MNNPTQNTPGLTSAPYILHLDDTGEGKAVPLALEGLPPTNAAGEPIHYRRMLVAPFGNWKHRGNGAAVDIEKQRADEWIKNVAALSAAGFKPFVTPKHLYDDHGNFAAPDARDTLGYVERLERDESGLYAVIGLHGDESLKICARNSRSIGVQKQDIKDAKGNIIPGETLHHLALVPNPALPIAASADAPANVFTFTAASAQPIAAPSRRSYEMLKPEIAQQVRAKLGFGADVPDDQLADKAIEKALALSSDIQTLNGTIATLTSERDAVKAEAKAKNDEVLAISADSKLDPLSLSVTIDAFENQREQTIASGVISQAGMQQIDALLLADGKPTKAALALSAGSHKPFYSRLLEIIRKNPGIKTGNAVARGAAVEPLPPLSGDPATADTDRAAVGEVVSGYMKSAYAGPAKK